LANRDDVEPLRLELTDNGTGGGIVLRNGRVRGQQGGACGDEEFATVGFMARAFNGAPRRRHADGVKVRHGVTISRHRRRRHRHRRHRLSSSSVIPIVIVIIIVVVVIVIVIDFGVSSRRVIVEFDASAGLPPV
jgi:hypothetical protein